MDLPFASDTFHLQVLHAYSLVPGGIVSLQEGEFTFVSFQLYAEALD
jgi:hypothetical protein